MPRPLPEHLPGEITDIVTARWGDQGLKGLGKQARLKYSFVRMFFLRGGGRSFHTFDLFCDAIDKKMEDVAPLLKLPERQRRDALKQLIYNKFDSVQDFYRETGISDTYVEMLFRGDIGSRITEQYAPLSDALGLRLSKLAKILRGNREQNLSLGYTSRHHP